MRRLGSWSRGEPAGAGVRWNALRRPPTALTSDTPAPLAAPPLSEVLALDAHPVLVDAWPDAGPFPLDGWFERNGFTPFWAAVLVFVSAFLVFQTLGTLFAVGPRAAEVGWMAALLEAADTAAFVAAHPRLLLGGNALGQALGFGLVAWAAARLSTRRTGAFLRLRAPDPVGLGLAAVGWAALYPVVLWLGELNARIPLPESLRGLDEMRGEMLEGLLLGGGVSTAFLFVTIALTPALFEELLFRGYLQRQAERRFGPLAAIVGVGVAFGLYHLSLAQAIPLSVLGVYLCFVVWATGSLWAGVLVHLLNNGLAVLAAGAARNMPGVDLDSVGEVGGPWYVAAGLALVGSVAVVAVCRVLLARRLAATDGRPDAAPVPHSPSLTAAPVAVPS